MPCTFHLSYLSFLLYYILNIPEFAPLIRRGGNSSANVAIINVSLAGLLRLKAVNICSGSSGFRIVKLVCLIITDEHLKSKYLGQ